MTTPDPIEARRLANEVAKQADSLTLNTYAAVRLAVATRALADELEQQNRALRSSVPERWKSCTSPVGAVQSYIAEMEQELERLRAQVAQDSSLTALRDMLRAEVDRLNAAKAAPAGWKLVPVEATPEMIHEVEHAARLGGVWTAASAYAAMVSAAPPRLRHSRPSPLPT